MNRRDDSRDYSFPDELGQDLFGDHEAAPEAGLRQQPKPFLGYLTPTWFGPFLLGPPRRWDRGHC